MIGIIHNPMMMTRSSQKRANSIECERVKRQKRNVSLDITCVFGDIFNHVVATFCSRDSNENGNWIKYPDPASPEWRSFDGEFEYLKNTLMVDQLQNM